MNHKELNHAVGLEKALRRKAKDLREQAEYANKAKDGNSRLAISLVGEAQKTEKLANDLRAAIDAHVWGF